MSTATATRPQATFLGVSDEQDCCDCCGKPGLKRTVALRFDDEADVVFYGTSCAARALSMTNTAVTKAARHAQFKADEAEELRQERRVAYTSALANFRAENDGHADLFRARSAYWALGGADVLGSFSAWMAGVAETGEL